MAMLREARKNLGLTQVKAAQRLGVSQPYLSLLEKGLRPLTGELAIKAREVFNLPPTAVPVSEENLGILASEDSLTSTLGALDYPGFAYLGGAAPRNPAELLVSALMRERLEARLAEALPWVLLRYVEQMDREWLVREARLRSLSNRLGFVASLAKQVVQRRGEKGTSTYLALEQLEEELRKSRLAEEDAFGQELSAVERAWIQQTRSEQAKYWNVLSDWKPEHLPYA